jgi:hypothetical protein
MGRGWDIGRGEGMNERKRKEEVQIGKRSMEEGKNEEVGEKDEGKERGKEKDRGGGRRKE